MTRILDAARLQMLGWPQRLGWPWLVLAISFLGNLALFAAIGDGIPTEPITGGIASIYLVEMIFSAQAVSQVLPFAVSLSVTRKSFYAATVGSLALRAVVFALGLLVLKTLEDATDGWGMTMHFFGVRGLAQANPFLQVLSFAMLFILLNLAAVVGAVAFARWGVNGLFTVGTATVLVLSGLVALVTWQRQWGNLIGWFSDQPVALTVVGLPILLAALLTGGGYLAIRRATAL